MIVITIEKFGAVSRKREILGQMIIGNEGTSDDPRRGNYRVRLGRKGQKLSDIFEKPLRQGQVLKYPRLSYSVWRLVARAICSVYPEAHRE